MREDFFYLPYNRTKKYLSSQYLILHLSIVRKKLLELISSVGNLLDQQDKISLSSDCIKEDHVIDMIFDFCEQVNLIQNPFIKQTKKQNLEKEVIISQIDEKILTKSPKKTNYKITDEVSLILSIVSEGLSFAVVERLFAKNHITIINEKKF